MPTAIEFSTELVEWAAAAGFEFSPASDTDDRWRDFVKGRPFFSNRGGEIIYFIAVNDDGWLVVTSSERMGREQFEFGARSQLVLERYFLGDFGEDIRSARRLPRLLRPRTAEDVQPGFHVRVLGFGGVNRHALIDPSGEAVAIGRQDPMRVGSLVLMSLYLNSTVADIKTSYESPDGQPLFTLRPPRTKSPAPTRPLPEGVLEADVAELVGLIADDEYVNGVAEDVIAHRRSWDYPKPPIRRDESWDGYVYFFYVGEGFTRSSGFRFGRPATPFSVPFGVTEATEQSIEQALARIRDSGNLPLERRWNAAVVTYDRRTATGQAHFFYGADAERWQMSPANADQIAAQCLALLNQTRGG
ncbi:Imm61 family immunity protein [Mycobacterium sp. pUA109]|uniref:Imm61 family immunity protein n=1 Tax=Mycobacterium sp. pUA109 TaxID=3238982 RepID=UPI00351B26C4